MTNTLIISKQVLPQNSNEAVEQIYEHFNGFDVGITETHDSFHVQLAANQYTYCEDIANGLNFLGIPENSVSTYCSVLKNTALCLSENWLPYAVQKLQQDNGFTLEEMTIIHVDDHQDLMSPFISKQGDRFFDMISGAPVFFNNLTSIMGAVESGAITIGSMLTVIIYPVAKTNVIHVKQGAIQSLCSLSKDTFHDAMLPHHGERICITKKAYSENEQFYFLTSSWQEAEKRIPRNTTCILHIDMDYFNNRYNASTSWRDDLNRLDTSFSQQKALMDELVVAVSNISIRNNVKILLIGISPSFYPAEFWADGLEYLFTQLKIFGVGVGMDVIKDYRVK